MWLTLTHVAHINTCGSHLHSLWCVTDPFDTSTQRCTYYLPTYVPYLIYWREGVRETALSQLAADPQYTQWSNLGSLYQSNGHYNTI